MLLTSGFKIYFDFLGLLVIFLLATSSGAESRSTSSSHVRRYTTSFTAPPNYRFSWGTDGTRISFGSSGSSGQYLKRQSLGQGSTIGHIQVNSCARFCEETLDCGFFHPIQLTATGTTNANLVCALYKRKMSKSTATFNTGSSGGKVVYSYGFTRNEGPVTSPVTPTKSTSSSSSSSSSSTGFKTSSTIRTSSSSFSFGTSVTSVTSSTSRSSAGLSTSSASSTSSSSSSSKPTSTSTSTSASSSSVTSTTSSKSTLSPSSTLSQSTSTMSTSSSSSSSTAASPTSTSSAQFSLYQDYWGFTATGLPDPSDIPGVTIYDLAFWLSDSGPADAFLHFTLASASDRATILQKYKAAGIKVLLSAFGATDRPQANLDAVTAATSLASMVKTYNLDGLNIDYEQFDTFSGGASVAWLIVLTRELRRLLPAPYLINHAPVAPWMVRNLYPSDGGYAEINKQVGSLIDYYLVQFYNQNTYTNENSLLYNGGSMYPGSSLFEIINNQGFDSDKIIVGKPASADDASNGYIDPITLGNILLKAKGQGWNAGLSLWQNRLDGTAANMISTVKSITGL